VVYAARMGRGCAKSWPGSRRVRSAFRAGLLALSAVGACTEPQYADPKDDAAPEDAGPPSDAETSSDLDTSISSQPSMDGDGGACQGSNCAADTAMPAQPDAEVGSMPDAETVLDPVRANWVGRYASRSYMYSWDGLVEGSARFLTVAEIKPTADGKLVLEEEICMWAGGWRFFVSSQANIVFSPTRTSSELSFSADKFESNMVAKALIGYGPAPSSCTAGVTTTQAQPEQVWLTNNTCDCPRTADVPSSARDCRLTDTDPDGKPGYTFRANVGVYQYQFHVAQEQRLRLLNGYRVEDRLYADREFLETTQVVGCVIDGVTSRISDCQLGGALYCPSKHNKTELVKIKENVGCAEVIQREVGIFIKTEPPFPKSCPGEVGL
jgi:hypothetical protein